MIEYIFIGLQILVLVMGLIMLRRNEKYLQHNIKTLQKISKLCDKDIELRREWKWRYNEFSSKNDTEVLVKFWKDFDSFYKDTSFLEEDGYERYIEKQNESNLQEV